MSGLRAVKIEKTQLARFTAEALNGAIEGAAAMPLNCEDSSGDAPRFTPNLNPNFARTGLECIFARYQPRDFVAIFENCGIAAIPQEGLNRGEQRL